MIIKINRESFTLQEVIDKLVDVLGAEIHWKNAQLEHDFPVPDEINLEDDCEAYSFEEVLIGEISGLELAIKLLQSVRFVDSRA